MSFFTYQAQSDAQNLSYGASTILPNNILDDLNFGAREFVPDGQPLLVHGLEHSLDPFDELIAKLTRAVAEADFLLAAELKQSLERVGCEVLGMPLDQVNITVHRPGRGRSVGVPLELPPKAPALQPCPSGAGCTKLLTGTCTFHHTPEEVMAAAALVAARRPVAEQGGGGKAMAAPKPLPPPKSSGSDNNAKSGGQEWSIFLRNIPNEWGWQVVSPLDST